VKSIDIVAKEEQNKVNVDIKAVHSVQNNLYYPKKQLES
jgi:hypothetical protein